MDISFSAFYRGNLHQARFFCITVLPYLGRYFCEWVDRRPQCHRHLCDNTLYGRSERYTYERRLLIFWGCWFMTQINSSVASTISNMVDFGGNAP